jgi:hypothetical protein
MSVYVDTMRAPLGRMKMCHMIADSREELYRMAMLIGVGRRHAQAVGTYREHFDVCLTKRKKAIAFGAIEVGQKELAKMLIERRKSLGGGDAH